MKILLLTPYHGGSHASWAEGLIRHSRHQIQLFSLPARFWKWRMHGGAVSLARKFMEQSSVPDLIVATDMLDLGLFLALTRKITAGCPAVLYMHENQLTYPLPSRPGKGPMRRQHGERDFHYVFINFSSMLVADCIVFNSRFHKEEWFEALPRYLKHFPEYRELSSLPGLHRKSRVLPVGLPLAELERGRPAEQTRRNLPLILWNQRWEYDKNPSQLFEVLLEMKNRGWEFELALVGQSFQRQPEEFETLLTPLEERTLRLGYLPRQEYVEWLWRSDLTVSTASHEFFGVSVLEAAACETFPILPNRLSYPEVVPRDFHSWCLYENREEMLEMLGRSLADPELTRERGREVSRAVRHFDWARVAPDYDRLFEELA